MTNHTAPDLFIEQGPKARIEIIPLIDVIFFLLATFVLFTLSLDRHGTIEVPLPIARDFRLPPTEPVTLQVSGEGAYYWDRELIGLAEVKQRLAHYAKNDPDPKVMLTSDDQAKYGDTVRLLDAVRSAGITSVSIETRYRAPGV